MEGVAHGLGALRSQREGRGGGWSAGKERNQSDHKIQGFEVGFGDLKDIVFLVGFCDFKQDFEVGFGDLKRFFFFLWLLNGF